VQDRPSAVRPSEWDGRRIIQYWLRAMSSSQDTSPKQVSLMSRACFPVHTRERTVFLLIALVTYQAGSAPDTISASIAPKVGKMPNDFKIDIVRYCDETGKLPR
jgi:hypothetical protein